MSKVKKYHGVIIPMVAPVTADGDIDHSSVAKVADHLIEGGTSPFIMGTTGESSSIPDSARPGFVETLVKATAGRTMTYAGISGNCLATSVELSKKYFDLGVDAVVAHLPSYYPLKGDYMLKYYEMLADGVTGPLLLYNIPSTTHMSIPLDVIEKLSHHPNIAGVKDSETDVDRMEDAVGRWGDREDFAHLTGSAGLGARAILLGSDGVVPSGGNVIPRVYRDLYDAAVAGDADTAHRLQEKANEMSRYRLASNGLCKSLASLKVVMNELGLCGTAVLPPLLPLTDEEKEEIKRQMAEKGIAK